MTIGRIRKQLFFWVNCESWAARILLRKKCGLDLTQDNIKTHVNAVAEKQDLKTSQNRWDKRKVNVHISELVNSAEFIILTHLTEEEHDSVEHVGGSFPCIYHRLILFSSLRRQGLG